MEPSPSTFGGVCHAEAQCMVNYKYLDSKRAVSITACYVSQTQFLYLYFVNCNHYQLIEITIITIYSYRHRKMNKQFIIISGWIPTCRPVRSRSGLPGQAKCPAWQVDLAGRTGLRQPWTREFGLIGELVFQSAIS